MTLPLDIPPMPRLVDHRSPSTLYVDDICAASGVDRETVCRVLEAIEHVGLPTVTYPPSGQKKAQKPKRKRKARK
jgi:hypothetical protein